MKRLQAPGSRLPVVAFLVAAIFSACGGAPPPPPEEPKKEEPTVKREKPPEMKAEIGGLDERAVTKTFEKLIRRVEQCQDDRRKQSEKLDFVAGDVAIEVRVREDGSAREAYLKKTTIGDRDVERCITDAAKKMDWPKPVGGKEGIAQSSFQLPMKGERDAVPWDQAKIDKQLHKAEKDLRACTSGKKGYAVTAYVDTNGRVITAGSTTPGDGADGAADCLTDTFKKLKLPSPGGFPAKVTVDLD